MATYRIEDYKKAGLPQEAERRMARIVELSSGLGYGAAEDMRNHKQFLEMIYKIKFDPKMETFTTPNAVRSTNSIVARALNAVARNFTPTSEFEIGDKVRFRDSVRSVPHDETYMVVKVSGKNITIKGGRDNGTSTEFANNLEIVENADTSVVSEKAVNAKFYATGYTNGGANEKQIGPFKTKEEAIKAGREEQGASGIFRFAGVVGEDGAYVYHNSRARNAIVAKALNAVAKNYGTNPFKEGGRVKWRYRSPMRDDYAEWNTDIVDRVNGDYIHIKGLIDDIPWKGNEAIEVSRNSSVAKALNYSPYRKGAWLHDDKGRKYTVVEEEHWGKNGDAERFVTIRDEQTKQTREVPVTELAHRFDFGEAKNAERTRNAKDSRIFKPGEKITWWYLDGEEEDGTVISDKGTYVEAKMRSGKVVYPSKLQIIENATALNWNYKNQYQFFCVDPSLKAPCILSGWDYREDAKDDAAELKEFGIPHKIVSRRFLVQQGIDPNAGSSWKKNRQ